MKKHKNKDPFQTLGWCYTTVTDPRQVFAECFNYANIHSYRSTIRQVLFAAASPKVCHKQDPALILSKFKVITSVLLAARQLTRQKETGALKIAWDQFTDKRLYARPLSLCPEWEYLPKTLTPAEYRNPYLVFHRFLIIKNRNNGSRIWTLLWSMPWPAIRIVVTWICSGGIFT